MVSKKHGSHVGHVSRFLFPQFKETLHKVWLQLAQWILRYIKLSYFEKNELDLL